MMLCNWFGGIIAELNLSSIWFCDLMDLIKGQDVVIEDLRC